MASSLNKLQSERLLSIMVQNPSVAYGYHVSIKNKYEKCWNFVEDELNSLGPPQKTITEWKKTWSDQKRYILKKKNIANLTSVEAAVYKMFTEGSDALRARQVQSSLSTSSSNTSRKAKTSIRNNKNNNNSSIECNLKTLSHRTPNKRVKLKVEENDTVTYNNNLYNITVLNEAELSDDQSQSQQQPAEEDNNEIDLESNQQNDYNNSTILNSEQRQQLQYYRNYYMNNPTYNNYNDDEDVYAVEDIDHNELSLNHMSHPNETPNKNNCLSSIINNNNNNMEVDYAQDQELTKKTDVDMLAVPPLHVLNSTSATLKSSVNLTKTSEHNCCIKKDITHTLKNIDNYLRRLYILEMAKFRELKRHHRSLETFKRQEVEFRNFKRKIKKE